MSEVAAPCQPKLLFWLIDPQSPSLQTRKMQHHNSNSSRVKVTVFTYTPQLQVQVQTIHSSEENIKVAMWRRCAPPLLLVVWLHVLQNRTADPRALGGWEFKKPPPNGKSTWTENETRTCFVCRLFQLCWSWRLRSLVYFLVRRPLEFRFPPAALPPGLAFIKLQANASAVQWICGLIQRYDLQKCEVNTQSNAHFRLHLCGARSATSHTQKALFTVWYTRWCSVLGREIHFSGGGKSVSTHPQPWWHFNVAECTNQILWCFWELGLGV